MRVTGNTYVNNYVRAIYGYNSANLWIEELVDDLIKRTEQTCPPIRLSKLLKLCGVKSVVYPEDYVTKRTQIRFTLAHEIAHTFFFDKSVSPPQKRQISFPAPILEKLCNLIASEILMPKRLLGEYIEKYFPGLNSSYDPSLFIRLILDSSIKFDINPQVAARRLMDLELMKDTVLMGVSWLPKIESRGGTTILGRTCAKLEGFTIRLDYPRANICVDTATRTWRLRWHAMPPSLEQILFIPKKGNAKIHFSIVERLFSGESIDDLLISKEPITNFRLGNLRKVICSTLGSRLAYLVYGKIIRPSSKASFLLKKDNQGTEYSNNPKGRVPRACPWVNG